MKKIVTHTILLVALIFGNSISSWSQDGYQTIGVIQNLHFGDFYLTGSGPGEITVNPQSPLSSSYSGVGFVSMSTIKPYVLQVNKTVTQPITLIYTLRAESQPLASIGYGPSGYPEIPGGWGAPQLTVVAGSQVLYIEASMSVTMGVSGGLKYITLGQGTGTILFKIGATLSVPANAWGDGLFYTSYNKPFLDIYQHWQVI